MKVLITGAKGFVGKNLAANLYCIKDGKNRTRDLNYDKYFKEGNVERNTLTEFNSNNTELLDVEQVKEKLLSLAYIREELEKWKNR